jgi:dihydrofolate reductase
MGPGVRAHLIGVALNEAPKYVASNTRTAPRWAGTAVLRGDLAASISELKAKPGGELQVHGSGALTRWLLENDLVESRVGSKGVSIQAYRPAGRPRYAAA